MLSATRDDEPRLLTSPAVSPADRLPVAAARRPAGFLLYLAFAGFVALTVGVLAGIGFLQFAAPPKNTVAVSIRPAAGLPRRAQAPGPISPEAGASAPIATAAIPGAPAAKPPAAHDAVPKPQVAQAPPPASSSNKPPAPAIPAPGQGAGSSGSAVAAADITALPPAHSKLKDSAVAAVNITAPPPAHGKLKDSTEDHHTMSPTTGYHRPIHARAEPQHAHLRTEHSGRSPARPSLSAQPTTSGQRDQAASFDRLMTQLAEPTKRADQPLTPPAAGAADPFAQPSSGK